MGSIEVLRNADGHFSMVAIDQRGSLRHMMAQASGADSVDDAALIKFKVAVSKALTPGASALLIDRDYGEQGAAASHCPVILAADVLTASVPGGPVDRAELDTAIDEEIIERFGAKALKMLVPWQPDRRSQAIELSHEFMELCRRLAIPGVVEGVIRPADIASWTADMRNEALVSAAEDLAGTKPDLYKTEVVFTQPDHHDGAVAASRGITDVIGVPWVILSSGVPKELFADALTAATAGGADGFLAGRALWADAFAAPDPEEFLNTTSRDRLDRLAGALVALSR
jgi:sulfofructosephosphate aldolase